VTGDVPFGGGFRGAGATPYRTWIGPGDILYSSVGRGEGGAEPASEIYTWDLLGPASGGGPPRLAPTELGTFCIYSTGGSMQVTRCDA